MKRLLRPDVKNLKLSQRASWKGELREIAGVELGHPGSSKHRAANCYRSNHAYEIREQSCRNRVPGLFHTDRSKVNCSDIKRGLRASVNGRGRKADDIIRAKPMHNFSQ